jgi:hypothetical protein
VTLLTVCINPFHLLCLHLLFRYRHDLGRIGKRSTRVELPYADSVITLQRRQIVNFFPDTP